MQIAKQIVLQNSKDKMKLTRDDVVKYIKTAITKSPKQMIDLLVKEVKLYNDKVEIFFKYNKRAEEINSTQTLLYTHQEAITSKTLHKNTKIDIHCLL